MKNKNITIILLVAILLLSASGVSAKGFTNIKSDWAKEALHFAEDNGFIDGIFYDLDPEKELLRSELASIMNQIFNSKRVVSIISFKDVNKDAWYYDEMSKGVQMGLFTGHNASLRPEDKITRQEAFVVLSRALKVKELHDIDRPSDIKDIDEVASWAKKDIYGLVNLGFVKGNNKKINPKDNITVKEFLQLMKNIVGEYINDVGIYTSIEKDNVVVTKPSIVIKDQTIGGDLILADGIDRGDIILDNVVVRGNIIVRGGDLILKDECYIENIYIDKTYGDFDLQVGPDSVVDRKSVV